jgi:Protein kinase G tetratricopeptide repeat
MLDRSQIMQCKAPNCVGEIKDGRCLTCQNEPGNGRANGYDNGQENGQEGTPVTGYLPWRSRANQLVAAIRQLERRELEVDLNSNILGVPIAEKPLRQAAEQALRHCAHFAPTFDERISLVDEANSIREKTWF